MTVGTDQLAACTTQEEVRNIRSVLEMERDGAQDLYNELVSKSNEYKAQADQYEQAIHDVDSLINAKVLEIFHG